MSEIWSVSYSYDNDRYHRYLVANEVEAKKLQAFLVAHKEQLDVRGDVWAESVVPSSADDLIQIIKEFEL